MITGANRGIGLEFARRYCQNGWQVIALVRHQSDALEALTVRGLEIISCDLTDTQELEAVAGQLASQEIDLLINNAGVMGTSTFSETGKHKQGLHDFDRSEWQQVFETNVFTPAHLTSLLLEQLNDGARVVTISSSMGSISGNNFGGWFAYRASKAAVNALMKSTALELAERGIVSLALHPGWVQTDMGGAHADIDTATSVAGMMKVIDEITIEDSGSFLSFDGRELPY